MISFKFSFQGMFAKIRCIIFYIRENFSDVREMVRPQIKGDNQNIRPFLSYYRR